MRTSRLWIERTVAELDGEMAIAPAASHTLEAAETTDQSKRDFTLTLSADEVAALDDICRADELSPKQALTHIVRARLLGQPQFGRSDRARLRACLDLLRALEQHVGRAARPAKALRQTVGMVNARTVELLELGGYLRRVGRAIGESMLGNLEYWRGAPRSDPAETSEQAMTPACPSIHPSQASRGSARGTPALAPRTDSSGSS